MADRAISALTSASVLTNSDLFVLSQSNQAKSATWQLIISYLSTALAGHGGISTIAKTSSSGLTDTYTITFADATTSTFTLTNGKGISSSTQYYAVSSSNNSQPSTWYTTMQTMTTVNKYLWSYIEYTYNDSTTSSTTPSVIGVYGDTGQNWYVHIKYAGSQPTQDADMGNIPDAWIGIYSGTSSSAPAHYTDYDWYEMKGAKGDTGPAASISTQAVTYQASNSGTVIPSGTWTANVPTVAQGDYLWTKTELNFNDGTTVTSYSVARMGVDGTGAVSTVNSILPDGNGNVALTASDIAASDSISVQAHLTADEADINKLKGAILYPTGDTTDRASAIASKLSTYGYCELVNGDYYIGSAIAMPNGSTIKGCGKKTRILPTQSNSTITMFAVTGNNQNVTVKDLYLVGSNTQKPASENTGSGEVGIYLSDNAARVSVENCTFYGFTKAGIYCTSGSSWLASLLAVNCAFLYCNYGVSLGVYGEFANITNCTFNSNYFGTLVIGGNNKFVNCGFDANTTGFVLWDNANSPTNDGHGSAVGCTFDHNTSYALSISNIDNGFLFSSCGIFYGDIAITNSRGIQFDNCLIMGNKTASDHTNFLLNNNTGLIAITNCCGTNAFTVTKTGTNSYVFVKNNKTRDGAVISAGDRYCQFGEVTGNSTPVGAYTDKAVTFSYAFPSAPHVQVTPTTDLSGISLDTGKISYMVGNVSTTGFTIRTYNNASIARTGVYNWVAFIAE